MIFLISFICLILLALTLDNREKQSNEKLEELYKREYDTYFRYRKWEDQVD